MFSSFVFHFRRHKDKICLYIIFIFGRLLKKNKDIYLKFSSKIWKMNNNLCNAFSIHRTFGDAKGASLSQKLPVVHKLKHDNFLKKCAWLKKFLHLIACQSSHGQMLQDFFRRNLRIFVISQSVCPWQYFRAQSNVCG